MDSKWGEANDDRVKSRVGGIYCCFVMVSMVVLHRSMSTTHTHTGVDGEQWMSTDGVVSPHYSCVCLFLNDDTLRWQCATA